MESERYKKFLEQQAGKNPVKIEGSLGRERVRIMWEKNDERPVQRNSSDILDSLYLGKDMQETVVVDRKVAGLLQDRLRGLEEENIRIRRRVKLMKILIVALLAAVAIVLVPFLLTYFPQLRILR